MAPLSAFTWALKSIKQARYEKNKLRKIARHACEHELKEWGEYDYPLSSPGSEEDLYLKSLKAQILGQELTMLGEHKLDTLRYCTEYILGNGIPGDIMETGVWRGGATIYLAGILKAYGANNRRVIVADSFAGLPPPEPSKWPLDQGDTHHTREDLVVSLAEVQANFAQFDLLDENVTFVPGFFEDSIPQAGINELAILRLDGDMYGSTMTVLQQLYHKLQVGGYLILDDWLLKGARQALLDFRDDAGIQEELYMDYSGVFWRKTQATSPS